MSSSRRLALIIFLTCLWAGASLGVEDEPVYKRAIKKPEEKKGFVSIERAQEMLNYEDYLHEKQDEQERLRSTSKTPDLLKELREGHVHKEKGKEKESLPQQEFLKGKLKPPQEQPAKPVQEKTSNEKEKEEFSKKKILELPSPPQVGSLEDEMKKANRFYEARLLIDYRSLREKTVEERRLAQEKEKWEPAGIQKVREALDEVPFLREAGLFPYTYEGESEER